MTRFTITNFRKQLIILQKLTLKENNSIHLYGHIGEIKIELFFITQTIWRE